MPSLTYLKLIGNGNVCNGHLWEQFIQTNLPLLKKFEFIFNEDRTNQDNNSPDIESIIASFQTSFWLKLKNWFVICEYNMNSHERITLYSIPICVPSLNSNTEPIKISVSTLSTTINKKAHIVQVPKNHPLFRTIKNVLIMFDSDRPVGWIGFVSLFINLTTMKNIILEGILILKANPDILADIKILLRQVCNTSSVILCRTLSTRKSLLTAKDICSIIPAHIQHLAVTMKDLHEGKVVLHRLEHLFIVHFFFDQTPCCDQIREWFKTEKQHFPYRIEPLSLHIWRRKKINSSNELTVGNKRIKLDDDHRK